MNVSFIIPAYNAAGTLPRCLQSIYHLPFLETEFEVVVVDDCSTDDTVKVCEEYSKAHANFLLIRQEKNHKAGAARNRGLSAARGEYIQFVDADDEIGDEFTEVLNGALREGVDVQKNNALIQCVGGDWEKASNDKDMLSVMQASSFCEEMYSMAPHFGGPPFYFWRREYLESMAHPFVEDRLMEDIDWIEYHLAHAEAIGCSGCVTYKYYVNANSTTHKQNIKMLSDYVLQCYRRLKGQESYKDTLPAFSERIRSYCTMRINSLLRFRHLTKFGMRDFLVMYETFGDGVRKELLSYKLSPFASFCLRYKFAAIFVLSVSCVMMRVVRRMARFHKP